MNRNDDVPIDAIARSLAAGLDRRGLLRVIGIGLAATFAGRRAAGAQDDRGTVVEPVDDVEALPCTERSCPTGFACKDGTCVQVENSCGEYVCPPEATCICKKPLPEWNGDPNDLCTCHCPEGSTFIDGECVCRPDGTLCTTHAECCSGLCQKNVSDEDEGVCSSCVAQVGDPCAQNRDCCNQEFAHFTCFDGACQCCDSSLGGYYHKGTPIPSACCAWPQVAFSCCAGDQDSWDYCVSACCTPGIDCEPLDPSLPNVGFPCPPGTFWTGSGAVPGVDPAQCSLR